MKIDCDRVRAEAGRPITNAVAKIWVKDDIGSDQPGEGGEGEKPSLYLGCIFENRTSKTLPEGMWEMKEREFMGNS